MQRQRSFICNIWKKRQKYQNTNFKMTLYPYLFNSKYVLLQILLESNSLLSFFDLLSYRKQLCEHFLLLRTYSSLNSDKIVTSKSYPIKFDHQQKKEKKVRNLNFLCCEGKSVCVKITNVFDMQQVCAAF